MEGFLGWLLKLTSLPPVVTAHCCLLNRVLCSTDRPRPPEPPTTLLHPFLIWNTPSSLGSGQKLSPFPTVSQFPSLRLARA